MYLILLLMHKKKIQKEKNKQWLKLYTSVITSLRCQYLYNDQSGSYITLFHQTTVFQIQLHGSAVFRERDWTGQEMGWHVHTHRDSNTCIWHLVQQIVRTRWTEGQQNIVESHGIVRARSLVECTGVLLDPEASAGTIARQGDSVCDQDWRTTNPVGHKPKPRHECRVVL